MQKRRIEEVKTHPLFEGLFTMNAELLAKIEQNMREENYDDSQPIILVTWEGQDQPVCLDGHTRLKAATNVGIEEISVYSYEFETEEDAFEYAVRLQSNRRNLTDGDLIHCIERLHQGMPRGGDRRSPDAKESIPQRCGNDDGRSAGAKRTADLLNISCRKVEQALTVIRHGSSDTKDAVLGNEISINRAYQKTQRERKKAEADHLGQTVKAQSNEPDGQLTPEDKDQEPSRVAPVLIPLELFGELHRLGGVVDDHVTIALERYLESLREQPEETVPENGAQEESATESSDPESLDEDDDEYFDPADYEED